MIMKPKYLIRILILWAILAVNAYYCSGQSRTETIKAYQKIDTIHMYEDSVTKYQALGRYYLNYTTKTLDWEFCVNQYVYYQHLADSLQNELYAIEQRKYLNKKYPEVKLK